MDKSWERIPALFPPPYGEAVAALLEEKGDRVEGLRLRAGAAPGWVSGGRELPLFRDREETVEPSLLGEILRRAAENGIYAVQEQLRRGYLSLPGGHRLGICGTASLEQGRVKTLREIQALNLRLAGERVGCAEAISTLLWTQPGSTLILGPPGAGKTTLLRDLVRQLSDRFQRRVGLVDERGEIAACLGGKPQLRVGRHTDVLTGCPKPQALELLIRAMAPEWIALDEITAPEDLKALVQASYCGVRFLATAHGEGAEDLRRRPLYRELTAAGVFDNLAVLGRDRSVTWERMKHGSIEAGGSGHDPERIGLGGRPQCHWAAAEP